MRLALIVLVLYQIAVPQASKRQNPKEPHKENSAHQEEKTADPPPGQTVVIQQPDSAYFVRPQEQTKENKTRKELPEWIDKINAASTFIIGIFTFGMFWMVRIQVREYRNRERAWVTFVVSPEAIVKISGGHSVIGAITNAGSSPAIVVRKFHYLDVVNPARGEALKTTPHYLLENETQFPYLMIPKATELAAARMDDWVMLNIEKLEVRILGQIVYRDIFGIEHETRYCFRYYPRPAKGHSVGFYPEGPDAYLRVT